MRLSRTYFALVVLIFTITCTSLRAQQSSSQGQANAAPEPTVIEKDINGQIHARINDLVKDLKEARALLAELA